MDSRSPAPLDPRAIPAYVGDRERDEVVHRLGDHYALDHLTIEEYEFRVQAALRATQWYELTAITSDLPSLDPNRSSSVRPEAGVSVGADAGGDQGRVSRKGRWIVPDRMQLWAIMGGMEIDLRDAVFTSPVTEIKVLAIMGGVHVRVPPGVRLETEGIAIMGGFDDNPGVARPDSPVVRITGVAIMGVGDRRAPARLERRRRRVSGAGGRHDVR
ncbi:MAG: DUF1707 and DUF2154 domain-containing protein [Gemmatimonadetes bacterium]|nr:DUF1707 and DUF2154 domain-containing protein [Gemmatimonadota bacterium]